jgi:hypothetical protein
MQKVEGSSPFSRSKKAPLIAGFLLSRLATSGSKSAKIGPRHCSRLPSPPVYGSSPSQARRSRAMSNSGSGHSRTRHDFRRLKTLGTTPSTIPCEQHQEMTRTDLPRFTTRAEGRAHRLGSRRCLRGTLVEPCRGQPSTAFPRAQEPGAFRFNVTITQACQTPTSTTATSTPSTANTTVPILTPRIVSAWWT